MGHFLFTSEKGKKFLFRSIIHKHKKEEEEEEKKRIRERRRERAKNGRQEER